MDFPATSEFAGADRVVAAPSFPATMSAFLAYATVPGDRRTRKFRQAKTTASLPVERLLVKVAAESRAGLWVTQNTVMYAVAKQRTQ